MDSGLRQSKTIRAGAGTRKLARMDALGIHNRYSGQAKRFETIHMLPAVIPTLNYADNILQPWIHWFTFQRQDSEYAFMNFTKWLFIDKSL